MTETGESDVPLETYREWVEREGIDVDPHRQPLPVRRAGGASSRRRQDDRAIRLGALRRRARRGREGGVRRRLFASPRRAGALRRDGNRKPLRRVGLPSRAACGRARTSDDGLVRLLVPGSFMGRRKPLDEMLEAFIEDEGRAPAPDHQGTDARKEKKLAKAADADSRIQILIEDQPTDQHLSLRRRLRRVPFAHPLGGPRTAALRGDRVRPARDHERQRAR